MTIVISTEIMAPIEVVFNLARSMDFHVKSLEDTCETIIDGKFSGLLEMHETVTFRGVHFGITQELTAKISQLDFPNSFTDEMISGPFKSLRHIHEFKSDISKTIMIDRLSYICPMWFIGEIVDLLFLRSYMIKIISNRANKIKMASESGDWNLYIKNENVAQQENMRPETGCPDVPR